MGERRIRYHLLALAVVLVWGVTFVCTKVLIAAGLHPVDIFWIRFVLAYAGIWLYILLTKRDRTLWYGWKEELVFLFLGVTGGSFYFLTENTALAHTQASNVSFLVCSAPLFTAIFTLIYRRFGRGRFAEALEKVRLGWPLIGGTVLAISGMALVAFEGSRLRVSPVGDLLAIGAALCWALYSLFMGEMARRYGTVTATRKVFFYGLLTIIPFLFGADRGFSFHLLQPFSVWANLLFLGLVASLACFIAWNLVIDKLGNVSSTNYVYLNPVFTLLTATIFLGERMTPLSAIGCAAILAGVIWAGSGKPDERRRTKLIILDFDGTLGDTRANIVLTMRQTLAKLGLSEKDEETIAATIGLPLEKGFEQLFPGIDADGVAQCTSTYRAIFAENRKRLVPKVFPHVPETLAALKDKGYILTIASSRSYGSLKEFLQEMGLEPYITYVLGANSVTHAKPHPEPVLKTMADLGYQAGETLVVGDMPVDILMGKGAGARTCGVTYGNASRADLAAAGADCIIDDFSQMLTIDLL